MNHKNGVQGLTTWNVNTDKLLESVTLSFEKAFGNTMKVYEVKVGDPEIDLLHAMQVKSEEINDIVLRSVQQNPPKLQFGATILTEKLVEDSEDSTENQTK